jgi:hypothetical protein
MTTLRATVRDGRLELNVPADWPDGIEVEIHPLSPGTRAGAMSPEEISATLAAMDRVEPFEMIAAEQAAWDRDRRAGRDSEKAKSAAEAERLRRMWE